MSLVLSSGKNGGLDLLPHGELFVQLKLHDSLRHALQGRFAGNITDDQFVPWILTMLGQDVLYVALSICLLSMTELKLEPG